MPPMDHDGSSRVADGRHEHQESAEQRMDCHAEVEPEQQSEPTKSEKYPKGGCPSIGTLIPSERYCEKSKEDGLRTPEDAGQARIDIELPDREEEHGNGDLHKDGLSDPPRAAPQWAKSVFPNGNGCQYNGCQ